MTISLWTQTALAYLFGCTSGALLTVVVGCALIIASDCPPDPEGGMR